MTTTTCGDRQQFLFDVFVTALEGGIGYWARIEKYHWRLPDGHGSLTSDDDLDGFSALITEEETGKTYRVDRNVIRKGITALAKGAVTVASQPLSEHAKSFYALANRTNDAGMLDASDADNVVQAGLFAELVYG
jgi:hypothetical protein